MSVQVEFVADASSVNSELRRLDSQVQSLTRQSTRATRETRGLNEITTNRSRSEVQELTRSVQSLENQASRTTRLLNMAVVGVTAAVSGSVVINTLANFSHSMARLSAVTGAADNNLEALRMTARQLGATTEYTSSQVADGMTQIAQAGFGVNDTIGMIPGILDLATASTMDLANASRIVTGIMRPWGFGAENITEVTDTLSAASVLSATNVESLGLAMSYAAPLAANFQITLGDTAAMVGTLANSAIHGERAGTALRGALSRLIAPSGAVRDAMEAAGLSIESVVEGLRSGDSGTFRSSLQELLSSLDEEGMTRVFGLEAAPAMMELARNWSLFENLAGSLEDVEGATANMASTMRDSLRGDLQGLSSAIQGLTESLGAAGLEFVLRTGIQLATGFVRALIDLVDGIRIMTQVFAPEILAAGLGFAIVALERMAVAITNLLAIDFGEFFLNRFPEIAASLLNRTLGIIQNFGSTVIGIFYNLWDVLVGNSIWPDTIKGILRWAYILVGRGIAIISLFAFYTKDLFGLIANFSPAMANSLGVIGRGIAEVATRISLLLGGGALIAQTSVAQRTLMLLFQAIGVYASGLLRVINPLSRISLTARVASAGIAALVFGVISAVGLLNNLVYHSEEIWHELGVIGHAALNGINDALAWLGEKTHLVWAAVSDSVTDAVLTIQDRTTRLYDFVSSGALFAAVGGFASEWFASIARYANEAWQAMASLGFAFTLDLAASFNSVKGFFVQLFDNLQDFLDSMSGYLVLPSTIFGVDGNIVAVLAATLSAVLLSATARAVAWTTLWVAALIAGLETLVNSELFQRAVYTAVSGVSGLVLSYFEFEFQSPGFTLMRDQIWVDALTPAVDGESIIASFFRGLGNITTIAGTTLVAAIVKTLDGTDRAVGVAAEAYGFTAGVAIMGGLALAFSGTLRNGVLGLMRELWQASLTPNILVADGRFNMARNPVLTQIGVVMGAALGWAVGQRFSEVFAEALNLSESATEIVSWIGSAAGLAAVVWADRFMRLLPAAIRGTGNGWFLRIGVLLAGGIDQVLQALDLFPGETGEGATQAEEQIYNMSRLATAATTLGASMMLLPALFSRVGGAAAGVSSIFGGSLFSRGWWISAIFGALFILPIQEIFEKAVSDGLQASGASIAEALMNTFVIAFAGARLMSFLRAQWRGIRLAMAMNAALAGPSVVAALIGALRVALAQGFRALNIGVLLIQAIRFSMGDDVSRSFGEIMNRSLLAGALATGLTGSWRRGAIIGVTAGVLMAFQSPEFLAALDSFKTTVESRLGIFERYDISLDSLGDSIAEAVRGVLGDEFQQLLSDYYIEAIVGAFMINDFRARLGLRVGTVVAGLSIPLMILDGIRNSYSEEGIQQEGDSLLESMIWSIFTGTALASGLSGLGTLAGALGPRFAELATFLTTKGNLVGWIYSGIDLAVRAGSGGESSLFTVLQNYVTTAFDNLMVFLFTGYDLLSVSGWSEWVQNLSNALFPGWSHMSGAISDWASDLIDGVFEAIRSRIPPGGILAYILGLDSGVTPDSGIYVPYGTLATNTNTPVTGRRANGGIIFGPGTSRSDSILAKLSNGEFVINAESTRKHLPLLHAINNGTLPGFQSGGLVGVTDDPFAPVGAGLSRTWVQDNMNVTVNSLLNMATALAGEEIGRYASEQLESWFRTTDDVASTAAESSEAAAAASSAETRARNASTEAIQEETTRLRDSVKSIRDNLLQLTGTARNNRGEFTGRMGEEDFANAGLEGARTMLESFRSGLSAFLHGEMSLKEFALSLLDKFTSQIIDTFVNSFTNSLFGPDGLNLTEMFSGFFSNMSSSIYAGANRGFSGAGGGGFFSSLWTGIRGIFGFASGGMVDGPGTGTSDSILAKLSKGEFVVNADATRQFYPMLAAINSGAKPRGFSFGGPVDSSIVMGLSDTANRANSGKTEVNLGITGDISRQTKQEVYRMIPEIAIALDKHNRNRGLK